MTARSIRASVHLTETAPSRSIKGSIHQEAPEGTELWDDEAPGLYLHFGKRGATYRVKKRLKAPAGQGEEAKQQWVNRKLGFAERADESRAGQISLAEARAAAKLIKASADKGMAPEDTAQRAKREARAAKANTFKAVADAYFATPKDDGGAADLRSRVEAERKVRVELAEWHDRPIDKITRSEIKELLRTKRKASASSANRLQSLIRKIFKFAVAEDRLANDPTNVLGKAPEPTLRERHLSRDEIRTVWKAAERMGAPYGKIVQLLLVTAQRRNEIGALRRSEIGPLPYREIDKTTGRERLTEARALKLPPERMKSGRAHTVPLSKLARSLIDSIPMPKDEETGQDKDYDHLFVSDRRGDQPPSGWSRYKVQFDIIVGKLIAEEAGEEYVPEAEDRPASHGLPDWHLHDLRATAASMMEIEPLAIDGRTISRVLGHREGGKGTTKKYLRHDYDSEAAAALERWAEELSKIVGLNVRPMKRKGA